MITWPGVTPDYIINHWSYRLFDLMSKALGSRLKKDKIRHDEMMERLQHGLPPEETEADRMAFYRAVGAKDDGS